MLANSAREHNTKDDNTDNGKDDSRGSQAVFTNTLKSTKIIPRAKITTLPPLETSVFFLLGATMDRMVATIRFSG